MKKGQKKFIKNKKTKEDFPNEYRAGYEVYKIGLKNGVILRPLGNVIYFIPPYIITEKEIDIMVETCRKSVDEYVERLKKEGKL